ncbi:hypothetical protein NL676_002218 [Syzygium grande]|nr:hypothetical protein NL676_002218 [Syzygium grande]
MGRAKDELEMAEPSDRSTDGGNRGMGDPDSAAKEVEEEKRRSGEDEGGGGGVNPSVERIFEGLEVPPWRRQLTGRALVVSFAVSVMFAFIVMKLNLTVGIIPSLNVSAGLLGFFFVKTWTKVLAKSGLLQAVPFTRQENTVIQTCVVASSGIAFSGGFGRAKLAKKQVKALGKFFSFSFLWGFFQWFYTAGDNCGFTKFPTLGLKALQYRFYFDFSATYKPEREIGILQRQAQPACKAFKVIRFSLPLP